MRYAQFERFELAMTLGQARAASHQWQCDDDVKVLCAQPGMAKQLDAIGPEKIRAQLEEYGAWDENELADDEQNRQRIVWIAAGNIKEEQAERA